MKVKILKTGEVKEVEKQEGVLLIASGQAERVLPKKEEKPKSSKPKG